MASISIMLVGKYIFSQLQVIGQSDFFLEATLNRMKSVVDFWSHQIFLWFKILHFRNPTGCFFGFHRLTIH
jgi:hypothetical protein